MPLWCEGHLPRSESAKQGLAAFRLLAEGDWIVASPQVRREGPTSLPLVHRMNTELWTR